MKGCLMLISDTNKTYIIEQTSNSFTIEKNNDQQHYEVLESINSLSVNGGNEEVFESRFLKRNQHLQDVPGFKALRFLRPVVKGRHYIIITLWNSRQAFYDWQNSQAYAQTHKKRGTQKGVDHRIVNRDLSYNIRIELESLNN